MSIDKLNIYTPDTDDNINNVISTLNKSISPMNNNIVLTELYSSTIPKIKAGSLVNLSGSLYKIYDDTDISTIDPFTGASVSDGVVYVVYYLSGSNLLFALTASSPAWDNSKHVFYKTTYNYTKYYMTKSGALYVRKSDNMIMQDSKILYYASDATERTSGGTGFVEEVSGITLTVPLSAYEIIDLYCLFNYKTPVSSGSFSLSSASSGIVFIDSSAYLYSSGLVSLMAGEPITSAAANTYYNKNLCISGKIYSSSSLTIDIKFYCQSSSVLTIKDRVIFAVKK